jgi:hypothetical protein
MKNKTVISYNKQKSESYLVELRYEGDKEPYVGTMTKEQLLNQLKLQGDEFRG